MAFPDTFSFFAYLFEVTLFGVIWLALLLGIFLGTKRLVRRLWAKISMTGLNVIALCVTSSILFQMLKMYRELASIRATMQMQGPPASCRTEGFGVINSIAGLFSMPCGSYYKSVEKNVFWELNVFRVVAELFLDLAVAFANALGRASGTYVSSVLADIPWLYRLPALVFIAMCLCITIFAIFGYRLRLFYGLLQIDRHQKEAHAMRDGNAIAMNSSNTAKAIEMNEKQSSLLPRRRETQTVKAIDAK